MDQPTTQLDTWAICEIMGHTKLAGRVKTEPYGTVMMLRVDVPDLPEKKTKEKRSWDDDTGRYYSTPVEVDITQPGEPGYTRYFGMQAVFSLTPCDEATAMAALERMRKSPPKVFRAIPLLETAGQESEDEAIERIAEERREENEREFEDADLP